ncbi:multicopper oxidase family protein [Paenibacillus nanensis]|uniref:Multicopper oxidase family protein n=1 Tax=Paenibacillus nanensis TaxID=393251 RepID=A0A3A1VIL4_9BACL|nr:multicopper oxidase family protein [Paenibacillus nanensis]RIX60337.1 multicopper oxidase family protein [Paenibacillus nanensis]
MTGQQTKQRRKLKIGMSSLLVLCILIGATVAVYFWQIRLQKPEEINMAEHMHHAGSAAHAAHSQSSAQSVSCETLTAEDDDAPVREFEMTAAQTPIKLDNGEEVKAWTFNGLSPGPEIRVTEGERVVVKLRNKDIDAGVTIHWHGVVVPCSQDGVAGVTQDAVKPGEEFTYTFIASSPGSYWYHSHQMSSIQAEKGLLGSFIVEPKEAEYTAAQDVAVLMQKLGSTWILNGKTGGLAIPGNPGDTVRLRLTNTTDDTQKMVVEGAPYRIIALDGHAIHQPGILESTGFKIGAGQRFDLLIELPEQGKAVVRSEQNDHFNISLGQGAEPIRVASERQFSLTDYGAPLANDPIAEISFDQSFELKLGQNLFVNTINGQSFHEIPPILVKEGEEIRITVTNEGGGDHPFHIHGHRFRVLSKNGEPLKGSPVYLDTILTQDDESYELYLIADNPGLWMAHCHNLQHASMGMSMMLNYEGVTTPYRVGTKSGNLPDL